MLLAIHLTMAPVVPDLPSADPGQARPARIGAATLTPEGEVVSRMDALIQPDGWTIPRQAKVKTSDALRYGISLTSAMAVVADWRRSRCTGLVLYGARHTLPQLRVCRDLCRMEAHGRPARRRINVIDVGAEAADLLNDGTALVPMAEATKGLCGEALAGLPGLLALNANEQILKMREAMK